MKKKDVFVSIIKGLITGVVSWINNMSIASMILSVSSYDHVIDGLSDIRKKKNKDLWYVVIPLFLGILIGLIAGHHLISFVWNKYQLQTVILFVGLFIGGIRVLFVKRKLNLNKKNVFIPITVLLISILLIIVMKNISFDIQSNNLKALVLGLITGISILIPGISAFSSNIKGGYVSIIDALKNLRLTRNIVIVLIFVLVCLITLILVSKFIKLLMNKNENNTYIILCSCIISSIIILVIQIKQINFNFVNVFTSILAFLWGYIFAKNVERE